MDKMIAAYSAYYFLKVHLHLFSKIKSQKEVTKLFLLDDRRIRIHTSDLWIRIGIQEAQKHTDPTAPDPQHWP